MLEEQTKSRILKYYLGNYAVKLTEKDTARFKQLIPELKSLYISGDHDFLKKAACYILLAFGKLNYLSRQSYEVVTSFLGQSEKDEEPFYDDSEKVLIFHHLRVTMENKRLEELLTHTILYRQHHDRITIVLAERELPVVKAVFGKDVITQAAMPTKGVGDL